MALILVHQTPAQLAARLRVRYKAAVGDDCARIATWLLGHIEAGDFTDAQVRTAFGLTAGQWTTLKAKMTSLRTAWQATIAAVGE